MHKSAIEIIASHKGANNGKSTTKGDGDGTSRNGSDSKEKTCNPRQNYTYGERY